MRDARFRWLQSLGAAIGSVLIAAIAAADGSPGLRITGMTFVGSRGPDSELVVRATSALFHPDSGLADLEDVRAHLGIREVPPYRPIPATGDADLPQPALTDLIRGALSADPISPSLAAA